MDYRRAHKVRGTSLPAEFMLLQMIKDIRNPLSSWTADTAACKWKGVRCSEDGILTEFLVDSHNLIGTLQWEKFPRSLVRFCVHRNELSGDVDLSDLPPNLAFLRGSYNNFTGTPDLCHLPKSLEEIFFSRNQLSGHVDFSCLPSGMRTLALRHNTGLTGTKRASELPSSLSYCPVHETSIIEIDDMKK